MARKKREFGLKPVEDAIELKVPVIRLDDDDSSQRADLQRLEVPKRVSPVNHRLNIPAGDFESRTHQPGIEALIENESVNFEFLEQDWGDEAAKQRQIPWGWFALLVLVLATAIVWSLTRVREGEVQVEQIRVETESARVEDAIENQEAAALVERIESTTEAFFAASDIDELAALVRHPERVRPLMMHYYAERKVGGNPLARSKALQPLTLDSRANFWVLSTELADQTTRSLVIEISDTGEPRVDWETLVCYQPMTWDAFASERPAGISLDFRVYVERDNLFSHEFANSEMWACYRLTALDSEETLFGYVRTTDGLANTIDELLQRNQGRASSMILRLSIPEGLKSRRGVVIEKLLSPRWLYLDPPDSSS